eukprot:CAMPEP_0197868938 /NCGR_PEP_ID=MMETSP1438-20131217/45547_1 /TAXON_ID=1461541 /ORGANISM="Pterosperma sp., Strain CCMP1384" /LENGTH=271 /DNA_ID=CAMNT_0043487669 /DNA_START=908 /DNA_END=1723 /DNA_ORIENTATION=+
MSQPSFDSEYAEIGEPGSPPSGYPPLLRSRQDNESNRSSSFAECTREMLLPFFSLAVGKYNLISTLFWTCLLGALSFLMFVFQIPEWGLALGTFTVFLLCNWFILKRALKFGEAFLEYASRETLKSATTSVMICIGAIGALLCTMTTPLILQAGRIYNDSNSLIIVESAITAWAATICSFVTTMWSVLMLVHLLPMNDEIAVKFVSSHGWMIGVPALYCVEGVMWMFLCNVLLTYEYHNPAVATVGGFTALSFLGISVIIGKSLRSWKPDA